jgi:hypothetical protein
MYVMFFCELYICNVTKLTELIASPDASNQYLMYVQVHQSIFKFMHTLQVVSTTVALWIQIDYMAQHVCIRR